VKKEEENFVRSKQGGRPSHKHWPHFLLNLFVSLFLFFLCFYLFIYYLFIFIMLSAKGYQLQQQELQKYKGNIVIIPCKGSQHHGFAQQQEELQQHEHHQLMM
jgi:cellulose synthase/poly-beta-1,6-N-acetylglucosamine synthase-like glycosyltransferase